MKVALNLIFLVPGETGGMEVYARELIPRLAEMEGLEISCIVNREAASSSGPWGEACPARVAPVRASNRVEWVLGEQLYVPRIASSLGSQVVHSLASTAPLTGQQVRVTTIHDLNYMMVPEAHFGLRGLGMRALVPAAARRSRRIIVDAASTREDLTKRLGLPEGKVDVVPLAASQPSVTPTPEAVLRRKLGLGDRKVVFSPGAKRPHKNAALILEALAEMPVAERPLALISGYSTPYEDELKLMAERMGVGGDLMVAGQLTEEELEGAYSLSSVVAVPSRYEGFGLPVLEAMWRSTPVIASSASSLPEVAGDAAILVSPDDPRELREALRSIVQDPVRAEQLARAGLARAENFSWDKTAELTAESYRRAVSLPYV